MSKSRNEVKSEVRTSVTNSRNYPTLSDVKTEKAKSVALAAKNQQKRRPAGPTNIIDPPVSRQAFHPTKFEQLPSSESLKHLSKQPYKDQPVEDLSGRYSRVNVDPKVDFAQYQASLKSNLYHFRNTQMKKRKLKPPRLPKPIITDPSGMV